MKVFGRQEVNQSGRNDYHVSDVTMIIFLAQNNFQALLSNLSMHGQLEFCNSNFLLLPCEVSPISTTDKSKLSKLNWSQQ